MPTTDPTFGWPLPVTADPPDGPGQMTALAAGIATTLTPTPADNTVIQFAADTGWDLTDCQGVAWGPARFLVLQMTRTGSTITASADGNIPDTDLGGVGAVSWRVPASLKYVTGQARCAVASADCLMYDSGTINIGALMGSGAQIRTNDFLRLSLSWINPSW